MQVYKRALRLEYHLFASSLEALNVVVHQRAQLGEAPAQRAARVVGHVPQQAAEAVAPLRLGRDRQVGQQRAGFL